MTGEFEEAIEEHTTEKTLSEILNDPLGTAVAHRKIGECYCSLQNFEEVRLFRQHIYKRKKTKFTESRKRGVKLCCF